MIPRCRTRLFGVVLAEVSGGVRGIAKRDGRAPPVTCDRVEPPSRRPVLSIAERLLGVVPPRIRGILDRNPIPIPDDNVAFFFAVHGSPEPFVVFFEAVEFFLAAAEFGFECADSVLPLLDGVRSLNRVSKAPRNRCYTTNSKTEQPSTVHAGGIRVEYLNPPNRPGEIDRFLLGPLERPVMDSPLWIDTHAPDLTELPQAEVRDYLDRVTAGPINLVLYGPAGSGKTAAARALARRVHADPENDLVEINVADFFDRTKNEIVNDPRFSHFLQGQTEFSKQYRQGTHKRNKYKRDWSKREMINHVLKEMAGYQPSSGSYKTILLDNAEAIREDFQQALRRVMERHYEATQFIITTRQPTKLIAPIRSRCFPVPVRALSTEETISVLADIATREGVEYDQSGLAYIAGHAAGDLRTAILDAQTVASTTGKITRDDAYEVLRDVGLDDLVVDMIEDAKAGSFTEARSTLDDLLVTEGYTGDEVLAAIIRLARSRDLIDSAELAVLAGTIDRDLATGTNDRLHLSHLLARVGVA